MNLFIRNAFNEGGTLPQEIPIMAKNRIFTVAFELPGDEFEHIEFRSDQTLLDADIILFETTLGDYSAYESYNGKPLLNESSSFSTKEHLDHWHSEIVEAVNAGKLVIVYLAKPEECYRYTGRKDFSGTGRSRVATNIVTEISSYESVPKLRVVKAKAGKEIRIEKDATFFAPYWKECSDYSPYEAEIEGEFNKTLLKSGAGDRIVGAAVQGKKGNLLFLPPLRFDAEKFSSYDEATEQEFWTPEAVKFSKRLVPILAGIAGHLNRLTKATPAPDWTSESKYRFEEEGRLELAITKCTAKIAKMQEKKSEFEAKLHEAGNLRCLLYEQGYPLEAGILEALQLLKFDAKPFSDSESEFDVVFVSPEGRCLGEAEGKDTKSIRIDKFSQLERNLQEDFARDEVTDYAKGVLFGNAYRLTPPAERSDFFTEKCISAAKRTKAALVRTPDLFASAKYLKEDPKDNEYAKQCRAAIFNAEGDIVQFPTPPHNKGKTRIKSEQPEDN